MAYWAGLQRDARFETDSSRARRQGTSAAVRARAPWAAGHWPPAQDRPLFPAGGILCRFRWRRNGTMRPSNSRRQPSRVQPGWHAPQRRQVLCDTAGFFAPVGPGIISMCSGAFRLRGCAGPWSPAARTSSRPRAKRAGACGNIVDFDALKIFLPDPAASELATGDVLQAVRGPL